MMYEPVGHLFTPADEDAPARVARLRELRLGEHTEPAVDGFARMVAPPNKAPLAMVNFIGDDRHYFAGLHAPSMIQGGPGAVAAPDGPARSMAKEEGWGPHVVS